jgi:hypothetical protein
MYEEQETMQASAQVIEADVELDVAHYRGILKQRVRYYLAQREAGVPAVGAAILDLIILGNLEGCVLDIESLSDVMDVSRTMVRQHLVELIRDGWVDVRQTALGASLHASEKAATYADQWIGIAGAE